MSANTGKVTAICHCLRGVSENAFWRILKATERSFFAPMCSCYNPIKYLGEDRGLGAVPQQTDADSKGPTKVGYERCVSVDAF